MKRINWQHIEQVIEFLFNCFFVLCMFIALGIITAVLTEFFNPSIH